MKILSYRMPCHVWQYCDQMSQPLRVITSNLQAETANCIPCNSKLALAVNGINGACKAMDLKSLKQDLLPELHCTGTCTRRCIGPSVLRVCHS